MAINFPDTPNEGDVHVVGTRSWTWDGTAWTSNTSRDYINTISETEPTNPVAGDTWFKSSTGQTFIYYDSYWIETGVAGPRGPAGDDASLTRSIRTESADTTLLAADANQMLRFTGTGFQVLTIPDVLSVGESVQIVQDNTGQIEFSSGSGVTLLSDSGEFGSNGQNTKVDLVCVGAGEYRLYGELVEAINEFNVEYLVIAGGGSGGCEVGGGGGAGGYRSSVSGESSGGGASAESVLTIEPATNYTVTVGAGGAQQTTTAQAGNNGSNSVFATITSVGGGGGGAYDGSDVGVAGQAGGSGGGGGTHQDGSSTGALGGSGTANQGFDGADDLGTPTTPHGSSAGGGGAGETPPSDGTGGDGIQSNITGTLTYRAGGGGGGDGFFGTSNDGPHAGGLGGGGNGGNNVPTVPTSAAVNTGGGGGGGSGGGGGTPAIYGFSGGSGVVILRYPSDKTITIGAGLTGTTSTVGANKVTEITAGTGNISFS